MNIKQIKILIVDKSFAFRTFLKEELRNKGLENIHEVTNLQDALYNCNDEIYDIVFTDIMFEKKENYSLIEELKKKNEYKNSKIIITTSNNGKSQIEKALKLSINQYLVKPVSKQRIDVVLNDILEDMIIDDNKFKNDVEFISKKCKEMISKPTVTLDDYFDSLKNKSTFQKDEELEELKFFEKCLTQENISTKINNEPFTITEVFTPKIDILSVKEIANLLDIDFVFEKIQENEVQINNVKYKIKDLIGKFVKIDSVVADVKCIAKIVNIFEDKDDEENYFFQIKDFQEVVGNIKLFESFEEEGYFSINLFEIEKVLEEFEDFIEIKYTNIEDIELEGINEENIEPEFTIIENIERKNKEDDKISFIQTKHENSSLKRKNDSVLTEEEIDSLLSEMNKVEANFNLDEELLYQKQLSLFNFQNLKISKEELKCLRIIQEKIVKQISIELSNLLNVNVETQLHSVDQMTYGETLSFLKNPTSFNILNIEPYNERMFIEIEPVILNSLLNELFNEENGFEINNNEIDTNSLVLDEIIYKFQKSIEDCFLPLEIHLNLENKELNPNIKQISSTNDLVVISIFEIIVGKNSGMCTFCYKEDFLKKIFKIIDIKTNELKTINEKKIEDIKIKSLENISINVDYIIGKNKMFLKDVLEIKKNKIIYFEETKDIFVNNNSILIQTKKGIKLKENKTKKKLNKKLKIDVLNDIELNVTLRIGQKLLPIDELQKLDVDNSIELKPDFDNSLEILVENKLVAIGKIIKFDSGKFGVKITKVLNNGNK